jgi:hypothetical protein
MYDSIHGKLFLSGNKSLEHKNYFGMDDEEHFFKHLLSEPNNWYYRKHSVTYTFNSKNYRTKEFDEIDWKNSIVIFGGSDVMGEGLDDSDVISNQLEKITGIPVINMGISGTSILYSFHNSLILRKNYPTPLGIVHIWAEPSRITFYRMDRIEHHGSWCADKNNYYDLYNIDNGNPFINAAFIGIASEFLWKDTHFYQGSYFKNTADSMRCELLPEYDKARDLCHPGRTTAMKLAEKIANKFKLL